MTGVQTCALPILSLIADDMILYRENPKDATRKLLELINEFGQVAGYKINAQKSLASLYTNDEKSEKSEREIKGKSRTIDMTTLQNKKVIIIGDRDGIPGPAIEECVKTVDNAEVVFSSTECFV